jgi:DNA invertase Pin-like site-specific DNA recombinase
VGNDKDSERRQREAIAGFAKSAGYDIAADDWFYDPAVSGADEIEKRPGFVALLNRIEGNGVRVVVVEDASRFARKLMTQELGILSLIKRGVRVLTASGDDLTDTEDEMRVMVRQVMGAFAELERKRLVKKLKAARERKKAERKQVTLDGRGKCGGRESLREKRPEVVEAARAVNDGRSLDKIAAVLAEQGHVTPSGKPYGASAIQSMLGSEFKSNALERRSYAKRKKLKQSLAEAEES